MSFHATDQPPRMLKEEISPTAERLQLDLATYLENPRDAAPLRPIRDSLARLGEAFGHWRYAEAATLCEEMKALAAALAEGRLADPENARESLLRAALHLPQYVDWLQREDTQQPFELAPMIDEVRAARGLQPLSTQHGPAFLAEAGRADTATEYARTAARLRPTLQQAVLNILRDKDAPANLRQIAEVFAQLKEGAGDERGYRFWWLAEAAALDTLGRGWVSSRQTQALLRDVDAQLQHLLETGRLFADADGARLFSQRLIAYLGQSDSGLERLRERPDYNPPRTDLSGASRSMLKATGPDVETFLQVIDLLRESLGPVKAAVEAVAVTGTERLDELEEQLEPLRDAANVLLMLNLDVSASLLQRHIRLFRQWLTDGAVTPEALAQLACELSLVESSLDGVGKPAFSLLLAGGYSGEALDDGAAVDALTRFQRAWSEQLVGQELIKILAQTRQSIAPTETDIAPTTWRAAQTTLYEAAGLLTLLNQARPAGLARRLKQAARALATEQVEEKPLVIDAFTETIATLEYALGQLGDGREPDGEALAYAERQLNRLEGLIGIPMTDFAETPTAAEGDPMDSATPSAGEHAAPSTPALAAMAASPAPVATLPPLLSVNLPEWPPSADASADQEIVDIFFEEALGELDNIHDNLLAWRVDLDDREVLTAIRRSFHTLKGSGRMVEQFTVGEFAWCYEQLLNRILNGELTPSYPLLDAVDAAQAALRPLVGGHPPKGDEMAKLTALVERAQQLAHGVPEAVPAPIVEEIAPPAGIPEPISEIPLPEGVEVPAEAIEAAAPEEAAIPQPSEPPKPARVLPPGVDAELVEIFENEAAEILASGRTLLARWRGMGVNSEVLSDLRRGMHTLKGSSRMAGFPLIGDLAQASESLLNALTQGDAHDSPALLNALQATIDELGAMMAAVRDGVTIEPAIALIGTLRSLIEPAPAAPRTTPAVSAEPALADQQLTELDQELVAAFKYEAAEILDGTDVTLQRWSADQGNVELLSELRRDMHTLKGSSRMTGFMAMGDLAHATESLLDAIGKGNLKPSLVVVDALQRALDGLTGMVGQIRGGESPQPAEDLINDLRSLLGEAPREERARHVAAPQVAALAADKPTAEETIRVNASLLNTLVNEMGESSIYRARIDQGVGTLRFNISELEQTVYRLRQQLRRLEIETEAQILFRYEEGSDSHEDFDPLELDRFSELQQLSRSLMESIDDLANIQTALEDQTQEISFLLDQQAKVNKEVQQSLMRTRMVRFSSCAPRLRRVVRQSAQELEKRAELVFEGSESEVDRTILDNMVAPLEHMLRNAMSHGIETPAERVAIGKPEAGTITLSIRREGAELVLNLKDDGAGLDYAAIRAKGEAMGMLAPGQEATEEELTALLLRPGFSTAKKVTQISGRGVGMDVLNDAIKAMRGALLIQSERGSGTSFTIRLPFSLAVTQALLVKAGTDTYAIPLLSIESVARLDETVYTAYRAGKTAEHRYGNHRYAVHSLGILLGVDNAGAEEEETDKRPAVLLFRSAEASAALKVDAILGNQEIIVKPVGPQFQAVIGISGATVLGDGRVVVVLELAALVRALTSQSQKQAEARALHVARQEEGRREHVRALVVDDSITMRKVTARFLERHNIKVTTAKDGLDALPKLETETPDFVILDIEMPRMDGFELAAHIRNQPHLRHIPIIIVTSRGGEKHRERANKLGVNDYLTKPYQEEQMLASVRRILGRSDLDSPLLLPIE